MAKKTVGKSKVDDFSPDDFDFGGDMDFDLSGQEPKDNRSPITRATKGFGEGMKDAVLSRDQLKKLVTRSMPNEFGVITSFADQSTRTVRDLYNTASREIRPVVNDIKRTTQSTLPMLKGKIPDKLFKKLDSMTKPEASEQQKTQDAREQVLAVTMADIFKEQVKQRSEDADRDDTRDKLKEAISQSRHRDTMSQMDDSRRSLEVLANYKLKVESNYQRKSLEIQYRQLFAMNDLLEESRKMGEMTKLQLDEIKNNTGLPDYVKLRGTERVKEVLRNRFINSATDGLLGNRSDFIRSVGEKVNTNLKRRISTMASDFRSGLSGVETMATTAREAAEMADDPMMGGMMGGRAGMAGNMAGGIVGDMVGDSATKRLGKAIRGKLNQNDWFMTRLNNASSTVKMIPHKLITDSKEYSGKGGIIGFFSDLLRDSVRDANRSDGALASNDFKTLDEPWQWSRRNSNTLNEIIPGYLARMYRELQVIRSGDNSIGLTVYDSVKGGFSSEGGAKQSALNQIIKPGEGKYVQEKLSGFIDDLTKDSKFTDEQKKALGKFLLSANLDGRDATVKNLSDDSFYWGDKNASQHGRTYADFFRDKFDAKNDKRGDNYSRFVDGYTDLGVGVTDRRAEIQALVNLGMGPMLQELGIVSQDGKSIDQKRYYELVLTGDLPSFNSANIDPSGVAKRGKSRKSIRNIVNNRNRSTSNTTTTTIQQSGLNINQNSASFAATTAVDNSNLKDQLKASLQDLSIKQEVVTINDTLLRIEDRLNQGIDLNGVPGVAGERGGFFSRSVGGVLTDAGRGIRNGIGKARKFAGGLASRAWKTGSDAASFGMNIATSTWNKVSNWTKDTYDIYVAGELMPRLTKAKLRAGVYVDAVTGETIKSLKDIKNAVKDSETGEIVLNTDDLKKAFVNTGFGKKMLSAIGSIKDLGSKLFGQARSGLKGVYGIGADLAMKGFNLLKARANAPYDVYVKGEDTPRLLALMFKSGSYLSHVTGDPLRSPKDIDGPVIDTDGNMVLTEDDLKKGLIDAKGRKVEFGRFAALKRGLNSAKNVFSKIGKFAGGIKDKIVDKTKSIGDWMMNFFGSGSTMVLNSDKMVDIIEKIHDMLNERLPKHAKGDVDGDGIREGSYADIQRKRKEARQAKLAELKDKAKEKGAGLLGGVGGLLGRLFKKKGEEGEEGSKGGYSLDLGDRWGSAKERVKRGAKATKGRIANMASKKGLKGLAGRGLQAGGSLLRGAGSLGANVLRGVVGDGIVGLGARALGMGATATGALASGIGSVAGAALSGAGAVAGGALSLAGSALGAIGGGIMSILSAPFVLPVLAVAAAGAGAYYGYKYFTRDKLGQLGLVRYVQYGFSPDDTQYAHLVKSLEGYLEDAFVSDGSNSRIDSNKMNIKDMLDEVGISESDKEQKAAFLQWYGGRFYPIFMLHKSILSNIKKGGKLSDVDDLKPEEKKSFINGISMDNSAYQIRTAPFPGLKSLPSGPTEVTDYIAKIKADIEKDAPDKKEDDKKGTNAAKAAVATAVAVSTLPDAPKTPNDVEAIDWKKQTDGRSPYANVGSDGTVADMGSYTMFSATAMPNIGTFNGRIDALTAIRYKAYGLVEMEADKVSALAKLEDYVLNGIKYGSGNKATWEGSVDDAFSKMGPAFQVDATNDKASGFWKVWFSKRFLPVLLNYATAVKAVTGKDDPRLVGTMLTPKQALDVAKEIYSTPNIWTLSFSPWSGYSLNVDNKSIEPNIAGLKEAAKSSALAEEKSMRSIAMNDADRRNQEDQSGGKAGSKAAEEAKKEAENQTGGEKSWVGSAVDKVKGWLGFGGSPSSNTPTSGAVPGAGTPGSASGGPSGYDGGTAATHPGNGTGGDINSIPMPKGSGNWAAMKDLITAAANMTGMDPKMMASVAAIESGFDPNARPKSGGRYLSTATGLYQFLNGTWNGMLKKYGKKYGIAPGTPATDPRANALMGGEFLKENANAIKSVKSQITDTDLYLAHFLGAKGAKRFLAADPQAIAANTMKDEALANPSVFYDKDKRPRTFAEVYAELNRRLRSAAKAYKIDFGDGSQAILPSKGAGGAPSTSSDSSATTASPSGSGGSGGTGGASAGRPKIPIANTGAGPTGSYGPTPTSSGGAATGAVGDAVADTSQYGTPPQVANATARAQQNESVNSPDKGLGGLAAVVQDGNKILAQQTDILNNIYRAILRGGMGSQQGGSVMAPNADTTQGKGQKAAPKDLLMRGSPSPMPDLPISTSR